MEARYIPLCFSTIAKEFLLIAQLGDWPKRPLSHRIYHLATPLLLVILALVGCSSSKNSSDTEGQGKDGGNPPENPTDRVIVSSLDQKGKPVQPYSGRIDPAIDALDVDFAVNVYATGEYSIYFSVGAGSNATEPAANAARSIDSFTVTWYAPDGSALGRSGTSDISSSGTLNTETHRSSITVYGMTSWKPDAPLKSGSYAVAVVSGSNGGRARRLELPSSAPPRRGNARGLNISIEPASRGAGVEFRITVERLAPAPEGEYLPTGEKVRVEILSRGEEIWSTATGRMFTQMIGSVDPLGVGERAEYRETWSGRNQASGAETLPGRYDVVVTIPAKPTPYIIREEFNYGGR